jgi:hypothetical protein
VFWTYRKLGFRPLDAEVARLVEREEARMREKPVGHLQSKIVILYVRLNPRKGLSHTAARGKRISSASRSGLMASTRSAPYYLLITSFY